MKDVVSTLPVLKNVFSRFFAQSILIGSFFGCSRRLDLVWVQPDFFFPSISDSNGKKESHLAVEVPPDAANGGSCFFPPGRCGASSAKITLPACFWLLYLYLYR